MGRLALTGQIGRLDMTREQQLETLKKMRNDVCEDSEDDQALYYAIRAIEALTESKTDLQPTCNQLATDCISRQAAIEERRYTFGNDEFSLEAAYHDCKLVFDGITDDDSFQEADTGLILYYANEIIYALQEALDKDTNVPSNDCISRQAAIDAVQKYKCEHGYAYADCACDIEKDLKALSSAQPERKKGMWKRWYETLEDASGVTYIPRCQCSECGTEYDPNSAKFINFCPQCGADMRGEQG